MNIIWLIREFCSVEGGFENMFDKEKTYQILIDKADDKKEAEQFATLIYGMARGTLLDLIHDVYNYEEYAVDIRRILENGGMSSAEAKRTLEIFYEAFGFPGYRRSDPSKMGVIVTEDGNFMTEYKGEVRDGKEHGVGVRTCYYEGKWCNYDECVWVDGVMYGYDNAKEMEFGMFEDKKIGFVVNDYLIGNTRIIPAGDNEPFDDTGKRLNIK
ncbi:MAG: hypothetical protein E7667_06015 [Ruminococcaceae bacterium]|nr:hypothetical protein [Oscillospiraceae bacterium]